jgi:quinol monooxygenase YgiN
MGEGQMEKIFCIVEIDVAPGREDQFRRRAEACIAAARQDLSGTAAYEWFIAEDGRSATVIEAYDDVAAVMLHAKLAGAAVQQVLEISRFRLEFMGAVPPAIVERMRERLGATTFLGPRFQGRLTAPAPGRPGPNAGAMIFAVARFAIPPGQGAAFRALAAEAFARVAANEPGTLAYEWFINADETECVAIDVYRDGEALKAHNVGPIMQRVRGIATMRSQLYGNLPPAALERFAGRDDIRFVAPQFLGVL